MAIENVQPVEPRPKGAREIMPAFVRSVVALAGLTEPFGYCLKTGESFHLAIDGPPHFMRLVIEIVGPGLISVANYTELNGDLCADPEIVFAASKYSSGLALPKSAADLLEDRWLMKEVTMHLVPDPRDKTRSFYHHYDKGRPIEDDDFPNKWAKNMIEAGYCNNVVYGMCHSLTHGERLEAHLKSVPIGEMEAGDEK